MSDAETGMGDVWIYDLPRKRLTRLTYEPGNESSPLWLPDEKHIVYISDAAGHDDLYQIPSGGTGGPERLFANDRAKRPTDVSVDGRWIIFNSSTGRNVADSDIWVYSTADKTAHPWLATPFREANGRLSPDGKWIAYDSNESGRSEIYVRAFPDSDQKWLVSNGGGLTPAWRGDGRELYYIAPDQKMMAVAVTPGALFDAQTPVALFDANVRVHAAHQYDVWPDGSRFLLNRPVDEGGQTVDAVTILQNWAARLSR
jgi:Tol biopolymer transport system component